MAGIDEDGLKGRLIPQDVGVFLEGADGHLFERGWRAGAHFWGNSALLGVTKPQVRIGVKCAVSKRRMPKIKNNQTIVLVDTQIVHAAEPKYDWSKFQQRFRISSSLIRIHIGWQVAKLLLIGSKKPIDTFPQRTTPGSRAQPLIINNWSNIPY